MKEEKTNVMRLLEAAKICFTAHRYDASLTDGQAVAAALGQNADRVFKTLVTTGASGAHFVFCVPVNRTLQLKKAAKTAGEKSIAMLPQRELLALTGYVHGGCSPLGMKKHFTTFFDASALDAETITVSAGRRGFQVELPPKTLCALARGSFADVAE